MSRVLLWLFGASLVLSTRGYCEGDNPVPPSLPCPGAAAWNEAHRQQSPAAIALRDETRTFTNPGLRKELEERFNADQRARKEYLAAPHDPAVMRAVEMIDADNLTWLRKLLRDKRIPTAQEVGENGVKWAWLLVQHADADTQLQAALLPVFEKRHEAGELPADDLAKLTDRIQIALGKPQRYGTQFNWLSGEFNSRNSGDISEIDAHRQEIGLMPLADYACMMNAKLRKNGHLGERLQ